MEHQFALQAPFSTEIQRDLLIGVREQLSSSLKTLNIAIMQIDAILFLQVLRALLSPTLLADQLATAWDELNL